MKDLNTEVYTTGCRETIQPYHITSASECNSVENKTSSNRTAWKLA